ncbi:MAG: hypothetical protein WC716_12475 [Chitinophagaceae bacterium]|jgi:hypothetical protein
MKVLSNRVTGIMLWFLFLFINGCISKPIGQFANQDFMLIKPFKEKDTIVYVSAKGQTDTIVFFPAEIDTVERRSFEQGFYDAYVMGVDYQLIHGSTHMEKHVVNGHVTYPTLPEQFYAVNISTKEFSNKTLSFFGLIYNEDELSKMSIDTTAIIFFNGVDKNNSRGINSFKFSPEIGIISYTDTSGTEWVRTDGNG